MSIEVKIECPLGSKCERIEGSHVVRCAWYTKLAGENPQTGEMIDEWKCAMAWIPIMLVENANTGRSVAAATESFRNEFVQGQTIFNQIALHAANNKRLNDQ